MLEDFGANLERKMHQIWKVDSDLLLYFFMSRADVKMDFIDAIIN